MIVLFMAELRKISPSPSFLKRGTQLEREELQILTQQNSSVPSSIIPPLKKGTKGD
jgi:hypothetical protein